MKREFSLDLVRVLCTLWIVCVWHLSNYSDSWDISDCLICQHVTRGVLFCFMFLSGFLLKKYDFKSKNNVIEFYRKRFVRFWPLFFLSSCSLYAGGLFLGYPWFKDAPHFLLCILGLSSFSMPQPSTLWFMSMLMFFYIITPFVKKSRFVGVLIVIAMFLIYYYVRKGQADFSFVPYSIGYFVGLLYSDRIVGRISNSWIIRLSSIITIILVSWFGTHFDSLLSNRIILTFYTIISSLILVLLLISWTEYIANFRTNGKAIVEWLSYSSFALYLFHRQVYQLLSYAMNHLGLEVSVLVLIIVFIPVAVLVSYFIQRLYDAFLKRCTTSR